MKKYIHPKTTFFSVLMTDGSVYKIPFTSLKHKGRLYILQSDSRNHIHWNDVSTLGGTYRNIPSNLLKFRKRLKIGKKKYN